MAGTTESQNKMNSALRYAGTSAATIFTLFSVLSLISPEQAADLKANIEVLKTSIVTGYGALQKMGIILGPVLIFWMGKMGWDSSSVRALGQKLLGIATGPGGSAAVEAQNAAIQVTAAVAMDKTLPKSDEAKNTLVAATIALPEVQTIVTDPKTALASLSPSVISVSKVL